MADEPKSVVPGASLPDDASIEWLRKHAKQRLRELKQSQQGAKLADAQLLVAREYGFASWRALKAYVDAQSLDGQLIVAARTGDLTRLTELIALHPEKRDLRAKPYEHSLLHIAAQHGHLPVVNYLLNVGIDVNYRDKGDNTYAMHWAAAAGNLAVVRRLADAGGDVVGHGDDHAMDVIGWACMWDGADDAEHRAVVDFLLSRGAKHHIFSAIAMDLPDEVRRIVRENPGALEQRRSHNESFETALHYAVGRGNAKMVELLLALGMDPFAQNEAGYTASINASTPEVDMPIMKAFAAQPGAPVLFAFVALHDWDRAGQLLRERPGIPRERQHEFTVHLMAKRGDAAAVKWLLDHGFDPNGRWNHYDATVTPLHMAAWGGHADVARVLLDAGADATIKDSKHDSTPIEWAEFFGRGEVVGLLKGTFELL